MEYILMPITKEIEKAISNCNEDNCDKNCACYIDDDCINNYHRISEVTEKMQEAINSYMKGANAKVGEFYPNSDRIQTMEYAIGIISEVLEN